MKGISDFLAFLVILIIIVAILIPLTIYVITPPNPTPPQSNAQLYNAQVINVTYVIRQGVGYLYLNYPSSISPPQLLNMYNYSNGVWISVSYSQLPNNVYQIQGYPPKTLEVQISYAGQTNYVYLVANSSALA